MAIAILSASKSECSCNAHLKFPHFYASPPPLPIPSSSNAKELGMSYRLTTFDNSTFHHSTPGAVKKRKIVSMKKARRRKNVKMSSQIKFQCFSLWLRWNFNIKYSSHSDFRNLSLWVDEDECIPRAKQIHQQARESFSICVELFFFGTSTLRHDIENEDFKEKAFLLPLSSSCQWKTLWRFFRWWFFVFESLSLKIEHDELFERRRRNPRHD